MSGTLVVPSYGKLTVSINLIQFCLAVSLNTIETIDILLLLATHALFLVKKAVILEMQPKSWLPRAGETKDSFLWA